MSNKRKALVEFLKNEGNFSKEEIANELCEFACNENIFEIGSREYLVLTDSEADKAFDDYMNDYIDECVLSELPTNLRGYFDEESFKSDVLISDGRGPSLATYDGEENETKFNGEWFAIYRTN